MQKKTRRRRRREEEVEEVEKEEVEKEGSGRYTRKRSCCMQEHIVASKHLYFRF